MHAYRYFIVDLDDGSVTGTDEMPDTFCTFSEGITVIDAYGRLYYHNGDCDPIKDDDEDSANG